MMTQRLVIFGFNGWELIEKNEFGSVRTLCSAPTFEELLRMSLSCGYIQPPVAIKLGEAPR